MKKYTLIIEGRYWDDPSEESIFEKTLVCEPEELDDELTELCIAYAEDGMLGRPCIEIIGEEEIYEAFGFENYEEELYSYIGVC